MFKNYMSIATLIFLLFFGSTAFAATYYVSPFGDDENTGISEGQAFQRVQYAVDQMASGDTLILLDGFYTGSLRLKSGIILRAKTPRRVIFSGAEPLSGTFEKHKGNVYKIEIGINPKQVFYKNKPLTWACWPNVTWSENWDVSKKWAHSAKVSGPGALKCEAFSQIQDLDVTGGYCFIRYAKGNSCYSRLIQSFDGRTLHWEDSKFYTKNFTGEDGRKGAPWLLKGRQNQNVNSRFFLAGALDLLDSKEEWYVADGILYFYAADGEPPHTADFLVKVNDYTIEQEEALANVKIQGVDFFATSLKLPNPENRGIIFLSVHFSYIGGELLFINRQEAATLDKPIHVAGTVVGFDRCLFAGAQNTALRLAGKNLVIQNCVFLENNRHANFESRALAMRPTGWYRIERNTFINNCSDAIQVVPEQSVFEATTKPEIAYNNICNAGLYNKDVSGVYLPYGSQYWTEFHHNWVHNVKGNGFRLDLRGEKLSVHHNVFWASRRGFSIEGWGDFNVYNNTSVLHEVPCHLVRNISSRTREDRQVIEEDLSFPPIEDWYVLNNLVERFEDQIGPSEDGKYKKSRQAGSLHPERAKAKNASIPIEDRGRIRGNITNFTPAEFFVGGTLEHLNLIPVDSRVQNGVQSSLPLKAEHVSALASYRGAYDFRETPWVPGSDWMPYGLRLPQSMADAHALAVEYKEVSVVPGVEFKALPRGGLN
jgi:hypothetical protein